MSTATATMPAAVLADVGRLAIVQRPVPVVERDSDVLLDVQACGICGTDLHILSTPPGQPATVGAVLGHEFVGIVREIGAEVTSLEVGDRVVVAPNVSCGQCVWCKRGLRNHCENWTTHGIYVDGGLAPSVVVPAANCFPIAGRLPNHIAALAEPLSTVVNGVRLANVFPGETAAVIGAGPIGLMFTALLGLAGATVLVLEPAEARASLARTMGAEVVIDPTRGDPVVGTRELTGGLGADVVVDAVGSQLPAALDLVRKAGRIVLFGMNDRARAEVAQARITRDELQLLGAFVGQDVFPAAIRLLEQGRIDLEPLVTHRIRLEELPEAVEELRAGRAVKVQVDLEGGPRA
ncbi:MAG: zinc-dependent alcohol dehydrogenase [Acidimicrobiia bacterium]